MIKRINTFKYIITPLAIMITTSSILCTSLYPRGNDDRLSVNDSRVQDSGYMNIWKQKIDSLQKKVADKVSEQAVDKPEPDLKKKTSSIDGETAESSSESTANLIDSSQQDNIKIGKGANQYKENGVLISETIDGKRYVYAGFDNVGKSAIQDAINNATAGDTVIIKAGTYNASITLKNGVNIYGGYDETGARDITNTPTVINGVIRNTVYLSNPTEINGITLNYGSYGDGMVVGSVANLSIVNNTFYGKGGYYAVVVAMGTMRLKNNNFYYTEGSTTSSRPPLAAPFEDFGTTIFSEGNNFFGSGYGIRALYAAVKSQNDYFSASNFSRYYSYSYSLSVTDTASSANVLTTPTAVTSLTQVGATSSYGDLAPFLHLSKFDKYNVYSNLILNKANENTVKLADSGRLSSIFTGLLANKGKLQDTGQSAIDPNMLAKIVEDAIGASALSVSQRTASVEEMDAAMQLAAIIKNPTEDQKVILDAVTTLMNDAKEAEEETGSAEVKKATDELMQMVSAVLLAQAVPDLLKEGEISKVKNVFSELEGMKGRLLLEYRDAIRPYYEEIRKDMAKNISILQLKGILSKDVTSDELSNMPPIEISKILDKLRNSKDKSFEEEYMLQQEAKHRERYLEPHKKILEDNMKTILIDFTLKLSNAIEEKKG